MRFVHRHMGWKGLESIQETAINDEGGEEIWSNQAAFPGDKPRVLVPIKVEWVSRSHKDII